MAVGCQINRHRSVSGALMYCEQRDRGIADVRPKESSIRHQTLQVIYSNSHAYALFTSRT